MDLSKVCSCLNNTAQIDGTINNGGQISSTVNSAKQVDSTMNGLTTVRIAYIAGETDNIIVNIDNQTRVITATKKDIQFSSKDEFPTIGSAKLIYVALDTNVTYIWNEKLQEYVAIGKDYTEEIVDINKSIKSIQDNTYTKKEVDDIASSIPTKTSQLENDSNFATEQYVSENGGKIDTISVNGEVQNIENKNVDIDLTNYSTNENVSKVENELQEKIDEANDKFKDYAKLDASQTFKGHQTFVGNLTIEGNITQNGEQYITSAEKVETKDDYILMRKGATGSLGSSYSGFEIEKYDGEHNGRLVVDANGIARVGDVGDEQPLLTRQEENELANGDVLVWDSETNRAEGSNEFAKTSEVETSINDLSTAINNELSTKASIEYVNSKVTQIRNFI